MRKETPVAPAPKPSVPPPSTDANQTPVTPPPVENHPVKPGKYAHTAPCDWNIKPTGGGNIIAKHNVTNETFQGSSADFNKALRG
jgi:hypothetical protein